MVIQKCQQATALCFLFPLAAPAQSSTEAEYTARYSKCMDASGGVTVEMLSCIAAEMAVQDARLNNAYSDFVVNCLRSVGKRC
ncbi:MULTISPECIES: lysozyme inhibitor LprI family protein [unclassified Halomonas]|uniref:lysozyme inhibitor LprI family protein n=1 Tax=unclassified Halomonas TaxID=2609666 RepID=UPI0026BA6657